MGGSTAAIEDRPPMHLFTNPFESSDSFVPRPHSQATFKTDG
jgi:hypothetical protein